MSGQDDIRNLLKDSILKLCAISVPQGLGIEVDGIICISLPGDDVRQIVVKVHEKLDKERKDELLGGQQSTPYNMQDTQLTANACEARGTANMPTDCEPASPANPNLAPSLNPLSLSNPLGKIKSEDEDTTLTTLSDSSPPEAGEVSALDLSRATPNSPNGTQVPCEYCQLLLPSTKALVQHWKKIHKAIVCTHCQSPFIKQTSYLKHLETHIHDLPAKRGPGRPKGSIKSPKAGWQSSLNRTSLVESKCGVCGDMQPQDAIIKHMIDYHYLEHCFTCQQCAEYFPNRQTLVVHRRLNHSNVTDVRCSMCDVAFYNWEITSHMKECADATGDEDSVDSLQKRRSISPDGPQSKKPKTEKSNGHAVIKSERNTPEMTDQGLTDVTEAYVINGDHSIDISDTSVLDTSQLSPDEEDNTSSFAQTKMNFEDGLPIFYKQTGVSNAPPIPAALGPFRCSLCDKLTLNIREFGKHNFDSHYRFTCPFCAQTFATKRNVRRHMRKHTGDRPYQCDSCDQSFYRNDDLRRHRVHVHEKLYNCNYCQHSHRLFTKVEMEEHLLCQHKFTRANITEDELSQHVHTKPIVVSPVSE